MPALRDEEAYRAFKAGELDLSVSEFGRLAHEVPDRSDYQYMLGLAHKYQRNWRRSLEANLRAIELSEKPEQGAHWNAGIAATALGNWPEARRQWIACGVEVDAEGGPIDDNYGTVSIRINPWGDAETLFAERIDPARAYLVNIPLPKSGYRFRDLVLHDGAKTGERKFHGDTVPVFNALQLVERSAFLTFAAFVTCPTERDSEDLRTRSAPGVGLLEDWSGMGMYCLRCSHGSPHAHEDAKAESGWNAERSIGIAAQSRTAVDSLLASWVAAGPGRKVDSVALTEHPLTSPEPNTIWWREPEES